MMTGGNSGIGAYRNKRGRKAGKDGIYKCDVLLPQKCLARFATQALLKSHKKKSHDHVRCGVCDKKMTCNGWVETHRKTHPNCSKKLPIPCNYNGTLPGNWTLTKRFIKKYGVTSSTVSLPKSEMDPATPHDPSPSIETSSAVEKSDATRILTICSSSSSQNVLSKDDGSKSPDLTTFEFIRHEGTDYSAEDISHTVNHQNHGTDIVDAASSSDNFHDLRMHTEDENDHTDLLLALVPAPLLTLATGCDDPRNVSSVHTSNSIVSTVEFEPCSMPKSTIRQNVDSALSSPGSTLNHQNLQMCGDENKKVTSQQVFPVPDCNRPMDIRSTVNEMRPKIDSLITESLLANVTSDDSTKSRLTAVKAPITGPLNLQIIQPDITIKFRNFTLTANKGIFKLWYLINMSEESTEFCLVEDQVDQLVLEIILNFLQTGEGVGTLDELVRFLNCPVLDVIDGAIVCLIIMTSLQQISLELVFNLVHDVTSITSSYLSGLVHLCGMWHILRLDHMTNDNESNDKSVSLVDSCIHDSLVSCGCCQKNIRLKALERSIMSEVSEGDDRRNRRICLLHLEPASGPRDCFLYRVLQLYMKDPSEKILTQLFSLHCDPFRRDLDTEFEFNVMERGLSKTVKFYVLSTILHSRVTENCMDPKTHCAVIQDIISPLTFDFVDIIMFWNFLHARRPKEGWEDDCNFENVVALCFTFGIKDVSKFLYGVEVPSNHQMFIYFLRMYLLMNDDISLSSLCGLALKNPLLLIGVSGQSLFDWLSRDGLCVSEMDVYEIAVSHSRIISGKEDRTCMLQQFNKNAFAVRFGLLTGDEMDKVDEDNYLNRLQLIYFKNNVKWNGNSDRMVPTSPEFYKAYEPRQPAMTQ